MTNLGALLEGGGETKQAEQPFRQAAGRGSTNIDTYQFDTNGDGYRETIGYDWSGNGVLDALQVDTDGDG